MRLNEIETGTADVQKLAAISEFLISRADDTNSTKTVSIKTFLNLARDQAISLTVEGLKKLSVQPPLSNFISDVQGDDAQGKIIFKGSQEDQPDADTMTVDKARATVNKMAKRAQNNRS